MKLTELEARLTGWAGTPLKLVARAGEIQLAMEQSRGVPVSPAAFLLPIGDQAQPNRAATMAVAQAVMQTVGVLLAVREISDAKGGQGIDKLEDVVAALRGRIVGWSPNPQEGLAELVSGGLVQINNGVIWWLERYRSQMQLRVT